jgi:DsbC/DsbD-like thiol-disulfide interchange protein
MSSADAAEVAAIVKLIAGALLAVASVAATGNVASAQADAQAGPQQAPHVAARLIAETLKVVPGQPLHLELAQDIDPGWHTYWSNPGDSGLQTAIDWSLPQGFKAGSIVWPAPERFAVGPVVDCGYRHDILLPLTVETPADLPPGGDIVLSAHASWLVCSDTCIPEEAELSLSIPVGTASEPDPRWADSFASSRARTPVPNPFPVELSTTKNRFTLRLAMGDASRLRDVTFFPVDTQVINNDTPQAVTADSEGLSLTLIPDTSKPPPPELNGVG